MPDMNHLDASRTVPRDLRPVRSALLLVTTLSLAAAAAAADFLHPEDAACQLPCEVHDAASKVAPAAVAPTQRLTPPQQPRDLAARKSESRRGMRMAQKTTGTADGQREPALADERVAR
jgi:hypothetical protein